MVGCAKSDIREAIQGAVLVYIFGAETNQTQPGKFTRLETWHGVHNGAPDAVADLNHTYVFPSIYSRERNRSLKRNRGICLIGEGSTGAQTECLTITLGRTTQGGGKMRHAYAEV